MTNSHHFGAAAWHLDPVGEAGLVGLAFGNSPSAMPAWGGKRALFGTNPIAAVFPHKGNAAISIDPSLSEVTRGRLMVAAREGKPIPEGWALDKDGRPTTDPEAGLDGVMLLVTALTGAQIGFEASSFFVDEGNRPRLGQAFLVIDPGALAGVDTYAALTLHKSRIYLRGCCRMAACGCPAPVVSTWRGPPTGQALNFPKPS